jgi:hypothetical protein
VDAVAGRIPLGSVAGISLVDVGQLDQLAGHVLHGFGQHRDLRPILLIGRCDVKGQKGAHRVHRRVDLRALATLVPVVAGARAALGGRLDRAAVEDGGRRLGIPALSKAEHGAEVVDDGLEAVGVIGQEAEVRLNELQFDVGDVIGVGLVSDHTLNYVRDWTKAHNTL